MSKNSKPQKAKGRATEFDIRLGMRLKRARLVAKMTMEELGEMVGVRFQQIQKYENGSNRISAGKLRMFCIIFGKPCEWFLDLPKSDKEEGLVIEHIQMLWAFNKLPQEVQASIKSHVLKLAKTLDG